MYPINQDYVNENGEILGTYSENVSKLCTTYRQVLSKLLVLQLEAEIEVRECIFIKVDKRVRKVNVDLSNCIFYILFENNLELFQSLQHKQSFELQTKNPIYGNLWDWQVYPNNELILQYLFENNVKYQPNNNYDCIIDLITYHYFEIAKQLKEKYPSVDFNKLYNYNDRPLICYSILQKDIQAIKWLVTDGRVNLNICNSKGTTPLFWCAIHGYIDIAEYLIESGADVNKRNKHNETHISRAKSSKQFAYYCYFNPNWCM